MNQAGPTFFDTYLNTLYNLFVSLTTSNYPDVMMPIFSQWRISGLFFMVFMTVNYFLLYNIVTAYFYYNYKTELVKEVADFHETRDVAE